MRIGVSSGIQFFRIKGGIGSKQQNLFGDFATRFFNCSSVILVNALKLQCAVL